MLLAIETAGSACSAAVARGRVILAMERRPLRHGHAEVLLPMIDRVMSEAGLAAARLDIVAAATGPGGFTGIRVGLAAAHGIALAADAQLVGITSFAAVAAGLAAGCDQDQAVLLVALDSRREDLYVQVFAAGGVAALCAPQAVLPQRLADYLERAATGLDRQRPLLVAGDAAEAAAAALAGRADIRRAGDSAPDALGVAAAVWRQRDRGTPFDPARPLYLRPPDVTLPRRREAPPAGAS